MTFNGRGGKVRTMVRRDRPRETGRSPEDVVRSLREEQRSRQEDYRERSLALHGLVCARCGRSFEAKDRHLLTVHHKDGNHFNNPADGSNWENLCVYCHEDVHSRSILGDYFAGEGSRDVGVVYTDPVEGKAGNPWGSLGDLWRQKKRR
ncbi:MAG: YajD family HNH nuclease [Syntrophales bacterium]|nr:YajD family HNH nuclease [Syntrophales bacterium]